MTEFRSAREAFLKTGEMLAQTHGTGVSDEDKNAFVGAAGYGKAWSKGKGDVRGPTIAAVMMKRWLIVKAEKKPYVTEFFTPIPYRVDASWPSNAALVPTFKPNGQEKTSKWQEPDTPGALFPLRYGYRYEFRRTTPDGVDKSQVAAQMVWLRGCKYKRTKTTSDDVKEGQSPFFFGLYANDVVTMDEADSAAAWAAFDAIPVAQNLVQTEDCAEFKEDVAKIMGASWPCMKRAPAAIVVRIDQLENPGELAAAGLPYRVAQFEPIPQDAYVRAFAKSMGPVGSQVVRHVLQNSRHGYDEEKGGPILLSVHQSPGNDVAAPTVHMLTYVYQENLLSLELNVDQWKSLGPLFASALKGRYVCTKDDELAVDDSGLAADRDVDKKIIRVKGALAIDTAALMDEVGFELTPEQFDAEFPSLEMNGAPFIPPPSIGGSTETKNMLAAVPKASRTVNLGRVKGSLALLRAALDRPDPPVKVVMVTPSRGFTAASRAEIRAMPDKNAAFEAWLDFRFHAYLGIDEKNQFRKPPKFFFAITKRGPAMAYVSATSSSAAAAPVSATADAGAAPKRPLAAMAAAAKRAKKGGE